MNAEGERKTIVVNTTAKFTRETNHIVADIDRAHGFGTHVIIDAASDIATSGQTDGHMLKCAKETVIMGEMHTEDRSETTFDVGEKSPVK